MRKRRLPDTARDQRMNHPVLLALKGQRIALGLTQREVARLMGRANQTQVSAWETGRETLSIENAACFADALGCELIVVEKEAETLEKANESHEEVLDTSE